MLKSLSKQKRGPALWMNLKGKAKEAVKEMDLRANAGKNLRIQHMLFTWGPPILLIFSLYVGLSEKTTSGNFFSHRTFRS